MFFKKYYDPLVYLFDFKVSTTIKTFEIIILMTVNDVSGSFITFYFTIIHFNFFKNNNVIKIPIWKCFISTRKNSKVRLLTQNDRLSNIIAKYILIYAHLFS